MLGNDQAGALSPLTCHDCKAAVETVGKDGVLAAGTGGSQGSVGMAVRPGAEAYQHGGGSVGVLLCHGFTGSPALLPPCAAGFADARLSGFFSPPSGGGG